MSSSRKVISTNEAPPPGFAYSQGILAGGFLFISGQIGIDVERKFVGDDAASQTKQAMENVGAILRGAGLTFANLTKITILLSDIKDFGAANESYRSFFEGTALPARACYAVDALPMGAKVEIEGMAWAG